MKPFFFMAGIALALSMFLCSCASKQTANMKSSDVYVPAATGAGMLGGWFATENDDSDTKKMIAIAGGGTGAYALAKAYEYYQNSENYKEFTSGYACGLKDGERELGTCYKKLQEKPKKRVQVHRYMFPAPEEMNGIKLVPHDEEERIVKK